MVHIDEQFILLKAPNPAAVKNGRVLSVKGSFAARHRTADDTLYWAECAGSGKTPYRVSVDFSARAGDPVCRCTCPSRQLPCKHAIGLLFEIAAGRPFQVAELPEEIRLKREKLQARRERAAEPPAHRPGKKNTAAQKKKLEKQLEGLDRAQKMVEELLQAGVGTLAGSSAAVYEKLAKDLGGYYLTGPQTAFLRIAFAVREIQRRPEDAAHWYAEALRILIALNSTVRKARAYLEGRIRDPDAAADPTLFETLGGVWRLEELRAIGACRENASLLQLSLDISFDAVKKEYAERGWWIDLDTGELVRTLNLRPAKALKYVKAEDSCFAVLETPLLYRYPAAYDRRVRWEDAAFRPATAEDRHKLLAFAAGVPDAVKAAKEQFKNTLAEKYRPALLSVSALGCVGDTPVLADAAGSRIVLQNRPQDGADHAAVETLRHLPLVPGAPCAVFGLLFCDEAAHAVCFHPYSVVTPERVIRLLY